MRGRTVVGIAILAALTPVGEVRAQEPWPASAFDDPEFHSTGESADADTVAIGDVTGDGRPDAVVSTSYMAYELVVFAQQDDRSLAEAARLSLRTAPDQDFYPNQSVVSLGDLDGDGDLDAATTSPYTAGLYHQYDGGLHGPTAADTAGIVELQLADLDKDGLADIVGTANGAAGVSVYRRTRADPTYRGGPIELDDGSQPLPADEIEVGDINSDGRLDIVGFIGRTLELYEARADGRYSMRLIDLGYETTAEGIEVADITGDGAGDVAASIAGRLEVLPQRDGAVTGIEREYDSAQRSESIEAADIDRDGRLDVMSIDDYYTSLGVWRQLSDGTLADAESVPLPQLSSNFDPKALALADLDCDGRVDAFVADFSEGLVAVRQNFSGTADCPPPPAPAAGPDESQTPAGIALAVRRRQSAMRARRRGVRARVTLPAGCSARVALRTRRGRRLERRRVRNPGAHVVRLKAHRRLRRGARLRVHATFSCGAAKKTLTRPVRLI